MDDLIFSHEREEYLRRLKVDFADPLYRAQLPYRVEAMTASHDAGRQYIANMRKATRKLVKTSVSLTALGLLVSGPMAVFNYMDGTYWLAALHGAMIPLHLSYSVHAWWTRRREERRFTMMERRLDVMEAVRDEFQELIWAYNPPDVMDELGVD